MHLFQLHTPSLSKRTFAPHQRRAVTIGNFDGVHRGHQAILALLNNEAQHRNLSSCVLIFEPHPREFFAQQKNQPLLAPPRINGLRDKLTELSRCHVDACALIRFNAEFSQLTATAFIEKVLIHQLNVGYVLVGDDFQFGKDRQGDYALLDACGERYGFDVARMNSYQVHGERVSSTSVRNALHGGNLQMASALLGRPYTISGHVVHGRKLGRTLGFPTLNIRFKHAKCAASGIFVVSVHGLGNQALQGVANLGVRPSLDAHDVNGGQILLEVHCLQWPQTLSVQGAYGKIVQVQLLHKLHDELKYNSLQSLQMGILEDCQKATEYFQNNT